METITSLYYQKFLSVYIEHYQQVIKQARAGHCMKITGFAMKELKQLVVPLRAINPVVRVYILSDEETGDYFIHATKLIEWRNDNTRSLLILIPVNNRTSAEDSYGDATFKDLAIDESVMAHFFSTLVDGIPFDQKNIWENVVLQIFKDYGVSQKECINYLLSLELSGWGKTSWGDGLYCVGLLPDIKFLEKESDARRRFLYNKSCTELLSDFSLSVSDKVQSLPVKANTIQKEIVSFLMSEAELNSKTAICVTIHDHYPNLHFSNWQIKKLEETIENVTVNAELIPGKDPEKELVKDVREDYILQIKPNKKGKVKLKMTFTPSPKDLPELQRYQVQLISTDGNVVRDELRNAKVNTTSKSKTVTLSLPYGAYEDGSYFLRVHALDADGVTLDKDNPFKSDSVQAQWEEIMRQNSADSESEIRTRKEQFQIENGVLQSNETTFFTIKNAESVEDEEIETNIDKRRKVDNMLQAFFNFRIEQLRKGEMPEEPHLSESIQWKEGSLNDVFTFDFGNAVFAYQIQNSRKLLELERAFYKHSSEFGGVYAELSGNPTETKIQDWHYSPIENLQAVPQSLRDLRKEIFDLIQNSSASETGVLSVFPIWQHIDKVRDYIREFSFWIRSQIESNPTEKKAVSLQNVDIVDVQVEMPDGSKSVVKLIPPHHILRLSWLVNIFDLYNNWEERSVENESLRKQWYRNLDKLFQGEIPLEISPLILTAGAMDIYQYVGEITFGWGLYAIPSERKDDIFGSEFRQLKSYVTSLLNITRDKQIDSDVNLDLVFRHIDNYSKTHVYTDKLVINLFNAGDANVFADALVAMEKRGHQYDYEIRLFADDKLIMPGEALRELLDSESTLSDAAENFSLASKNRLFPKLRFSVNSLQEFLSSPYKYQAHISFLVNPFPVKTEMVRPDKLSRSFFLNGVIIKSAVAYHEQNKTKIWSRYFAKQTLPSPVNEFANESICLFNNIGDLIGKIVSSTATLSVPATSLAIHEKDAMLLSFIHNVSDWVVTFDKNMGPEFYDLPLGDTKEKPYLLDYVPGQERLGVSSFLTTLPTSEVEGLLKPQFEEFGISVDADQLGELLEDVRAVSSSMVMQSQSTRNRAFEVLGITFMKRMLKKKGLLKEAFIIPIDLHKELFENLDTQSKKRADCIIVTIDTESGEITMQVYELKCRKSLTEAEEESLEDEMVQQMNNTIEALDEHFGHSGQSRFFDKSDKLDYELKTLELANLLNFYVQRAGRYHIIDNEMCEEYMDFLANLTEREYEIKYLRRGVIFNFGQNKKQVKDMYGDALIYKMGLPVIEDILSGDSPLETISIDDADREFIDDFPKTKRCLPDKKVGLGDNSVDKELVTDDIPSVSFPQKGTQDMQKHENYLENETADVHDRIVSHNIETEGTGNDLIVLKNNDSHAVDKDRSKDTKTDTNYVEPSFDLFVGTETPTSQYGILGHTIPNNKRIALDLNGCNTISLFGVQGAGKSYTIGVIAEMMLKQFSNVNRLRSPLASVIFHYSDTMDYAPEFTSMIYPNDETSQLARLKEVYGAEPGCVDDVVILTTESKLDERKEEYPNIEVHPIGFDSSELQVKDWMFLLGAVGNDSTYIKEFKQILKKLGTKNLSLKNIKHGIVASQFLSQSQKSLAAQRIGFAEDYITDGSCLRQYLKPGRLIIVDLRDEFIEKDEALGLFVVMLNIFSGVKAINGESFNKFIVFDEAHKYMDDKKLVDSISTAIKEMRHKGVSIMIASQNPVGLPTEIIELSSLILLHRFNSPAWVQHMKKAVTALGNLSAAEMSSLGSGEAYLWANKANDRTVTMRPIKISVRPRVTKHGGDTIQASQE